MRIDLSCFIAEYNEVRPALSAMQKGVRKRKSMVTMSVTSCVIDNRNDVQ